MQTDENLVAELEEDVKEESLKHGPFDSVKVICCIVSMFLSLCFYYYGSINRYIYNFTGL